MTNPPQATPGDGSGGRVRASGRWSSRRRDDRPDDWSSIRDRVNLADVGRRLMGEPPGRRGEHGKRLWRRCPFHEDNNPSFCIEPGRRHWRCFGCGAHGDAVALVMKHNRAAFREAVAFITSDARLATPSAPAPKPRPNYRASGATMEALRSPPDTFVESIRGEVRESRRRDEPVGHRGSVVDGDRRVRRSAV
jgi:CHC2 zinc finger